MAKVEEKDGFKLIVPESGSSTAAIYSHGDGTNGRIDPVGGVDLKYCVAHGDDNDAGNIDFYANADQTPDDGHGKWYDYNLSAIGELLSEEAVRDLGGWADENGVAVALVSTSTTTANVLNGLSGYSTIRALNCRPE